MEFVSIIDAAGHKRLRVPERGLNGNALARLLEEIGLTLPASAKLAAAEDRFLGDGGKRFTEAEVDAALAPFVDLHPAARMSVKIAMSTHGLIGRSAA